jgi:hypothetical protein
VPSDGDSVYRRGPTGGIYFSKHRNGKWDFKSAPGAYTALTQSLKPRASGLAMHVRR